MFGLGAKNIFDDDYSFKVTGEIRIISKVSQGGSGCVYKAALKGLGGFEKIVALKVLFGDKTDENELDYFFNEARLVSRLVHENIVQLYSLGNHKGHYFIVYEFISGVTLYEFMHVHQYFNSTVPIDIAVFIISRIARGLAFAHESLDDYGMPNNIVHRDICPRNIMISTCGQPKLADFGIAIARDCVYPERFAGKPLYMSPEQATSGKIDFRSDIFSLGLVLFELLSGSVARDITKGEVFLEHQIKYGEVDWSKLPEHIPEDICEVLHKMLTVNLDNRYQSTTDLAYDLEIAIHAHGLVPTISTMAEYLKQQMPHIFSNRDRSGIPEINQDSYDALCQQFASRHDKVYKKNTSKKKKMSQMFNDPNPPL